MAFGVSILPGRSSRAHGYSSRSRRRPRLAILASAQDDADVIVIGSGIGGLVTATQLARKGARVVVLEKYLIPGGSAGMFQRPPGYRFDVGASMIFGFGERGTTNLLTRALADVGQRIDTVPDPVQISYHLPRGLDVRVHREYEEFVEELSERFPHERQGIRKFYDECWNVFNCLNCMELLSLEEPNYLLRVFFQHPLACLGLLWYFPQNAGDVARRHIRDPELLSFIDMECYCWSVVNADMTPMINAGMVFSDRHYGGINYPKGGVGRIAEKLVAGLESNGSSIEYQARVTEILMEEGNAVGVRMADGREIRARRVVSNSTRWDTFLQLVPQDHVPESERKFQSRYTKSPSFLSLHLGVARTVISETEDCHHIVLENWDHLETASNADGTIFVSIPTLLDPTLAPPDQHIFHVFTPCWVDEFQDLSPSEYAERKNALADRLIDRLDVACFPGLSQAVRFREVGTPRTHRRFLGRVDGSYGPIPQKRLRGLLSMPFNRTQVPGLYCVGDSAFPGQGLNAVAFSGFACGHRIAVDLGFEPALPIGDDLLAGLLSEGRLLL